MTTTQQTQPLDHIKSIINSVSETAKKLNTEVCSTDIENDVRYLLCELYSTEFLAYYASLKAFEKMAANTDFWTETIGVKNDVDEKFVKDQFYFTIYTDFYLLNDNGRL